MNASLRFSKYFCFVIALVITASLKAQSSFDFNDKSIAPGTKQHFLIPISDGTASTSIPLTIFHGKENGPVLGATAGVHGYEYAPILAGQQLIHRIDPQQLKGTVILVQVANLGSFLGRSPFTNPLDNKNLNRAFPGNPNGSVAERIAHFITEKVIARSDFFMDMHSGDASEDLTAYTAYYQNDEFPEASKKGRDMASNMGFDFVVIFKTTGKSYMEEGNPSLYCSSEAFKRGIPAIDIECGKLGMVEPDLVAKIVDGVESLLGHLEMMETETLTPEKIQYFPTRTYISSDQTGFFYPLKHSGDYVSEGMKVGYITNLFGEKTKDIYATSNGVLLYLLGTPPVKDGETLVAIGDLPIASEAD